MSWRGCAKMKKIVLLVSLVFLLNGVFSQLNHFNEINSSVTIIENQITKTEISMALNNAKKFDSLIEKYSKEFNVNANLVRAIIQVESSFDASAVGRDESGNASSFGLMQIHESNLNAWTDIFGSDWKTTRTWANPENSILAGTRLLGQLESQVSFLGCSESHLNRILPASGVAEATWKTALKIAAYNAGFGVNNSRVNCNEINVKSTRETYVPKVIAWYKIFTENYSGNSAFYYDNQGKVEVDNEWAAYLIPQVLFNNAEDSISSLALQSNTSEKYYFDSSRKKTVLLNVPKGRAYRIIKNENEFSPYWVGVKDITQYKSEKEGISTPLEAEIAVGFVPKLTYVWYTESKDFPFFEFECDTGILSDSSIELSVGEKKTCSSVTVKLISVNENSVSLEIEYNETPEMQSIPLAEKEKPREFSFDFVSRPSPKTFRLEGYPIYVFFYGLFQIGSENIPSIEFSFLPDRQFSVAIIDNEKILVSSELKDNKVFVSVNESIQVLENPPTEFTSMKKPSGVQVKAIIGEEYYGPFLEGKLQSALVDSKGKEYPLTLTQENSLTAFVPQDTYSLKITALDSFYNDWVSPQDITATFTPTIIDVSKVNVKKETVAVDVQIPEPLHKAMDSVGVTPLIEIGEKKADLDFTAVKESTPYYDFFFDSIVGEEFKITIPETTATKQWLWKEKIEKDTRIEVPAGIMKEREFKPKEKFKVVFLVGEKNFGLLEKEDWSVIKFKQLEGGNKTVVVISDNEKKDRFTAEFTKGNTYNLIIEESPSTRHYDYLNEFYAKPFSHKFSGGPITEADSLIDLSSEFFGKSDSVFFEGKGKELARKEIEFKEVVGEKHANLQIKSVNGKYAATNKEGIPAHIVYLPQGTHKIEVLLQGFTDKTLFFSVGAKDSFGFPPSVKLNPSDYPLQVPSFYFNDIKNGMKFSALWNEGSKLVIDEWDGTPLQVYVCQDKTGNGKCDLKGYDEKGNEVYGADFREPNLEAASIEIQLEEKTQREEGELTITIEYDLGEVCPVEDECTKEFKETKPETLRKAKEQVCKEKQCTVLDLGENNIVIQVPEGSITINEITIEGDKYVFNYVPEEREITVRKGETNAIILKPESKKKQEQVVTGYERIGEKSSACVTAMQNAKKYEALIERYGNENHYSMDPNLIRAIIQAESSFNPEAVGKDEKGEASSFGLMQIHESNLNAWTDIFGSDWKTTESWKDAENSIWAGTRYFNSTEKGDDSLEKWINSLNCNESQLNKVLPASGVAEATWKTALKIAAYNAGPENVSCTEIKAVKTRTEYLPKVIAWYRIFTENYGKEAELGDDYCKPTKAVAVEPPLIVTECSDCSTILECLACLDYKFVSGVFKQ
jgi:soluble lytic murein transglycosylase-like protein